jgi:hypothetical protein
MATSIKVDKGVPIPGWSMFNETLLTMKVGDSIFCGLEKSEALRQAMTRIAKKTKMKFSWRQSVENGKTGKRMWRIK